MCIYLIRILKFKGEEFYTLAQTEGLSALVPISGYVNKLIYRVNCIFFQHSLFFFVILFIFYF